LALALRNENGSLFWEIDVEDKLEKKAAVDRGVAIEVDQKQRFSLFLLGKKISSHFMSHLVHG
jgi:hypothetical protein